MTEWMSIGNNDKKIKVDNQEMFLDKLTNYFPKRETSLNINAGGNIPFPWEVNFLLFPFNKAMKEVHGCNMFNFWFESEGFPGSGGADFIADSFRTIHQPGNTEFAYIHPYHRWVELGDVLFGGRYGQPLTFGPFLPGLYWVNFLGRKHLDLFDLSKIKEIKAYQVEWISDQGLFIRISRDIFVAANSEVEAEMFDLTEKFRAARLK